MAVVKLQEVAARKRTLEWGSEHKWDEVGSAQGGCGGDGSYTRDTDPKSKPIGNNGRKLQIGKERRQNELCGVELEPELIDRNSDFW